MYAHTRAAPVLAMESETPERLCVVWRAAALIGAHAHSPVPKTEAGSG